MKNSLDTIAPEEYVSAFKSLKLRMGFVALIVPLLIYLLTLSTGAFPGQSSALVVTYSGLQPYVAPAHTIWGFFARAVASLSVGDMVLYLNSFSLVVGLIGLWLVYDIVSRSVFTLIDYELASAKVVARASVIAGLVAAFVLAFSVPYWIASTRLHYQAFNLVLLLASIRLLICYLSTDKVWVLWLFSLLYGIIVIESITLILFAPFAVIVLVRHWSQGAKIGVGRIITSVLFFLVGLASVLLCAYYFSANYDLSLRGYESVFQVARSLIMDQVGLLKTVFPKLGWIYLLLFVVIPALASLAIAPRSFGEVRDLGIVIMNSAFTVAVCIVAANAPVCSTWALFRHSGELPILLFSMTAGVAGYLAAFWFILFYNRLADSDSLVQHTSSANMWFSSIFGLLIVAIIPISSVINGIEANGKRGSFVDECVSELIDSLDGRRWIVADGLFDNHILIEAHCKGLDVNVIALQNNDNQVYLRYLRDMIKDDPDLPADKMTALDNSASIGVLPFLQEWMSIDTNAIDKIAIVNYPDLIISQDRVVVPAKFFFIAGSMEGMKGAPFLAEHREFWARILPVLEKSRSDRDVLAEYREMLRRQVGFVANNAGILLEDLNMDREAADAYQYVRKLDPDNISALLNLVEMSHRKDCLSAEEKENVKKSFDQKIKELDGRKWPIWSLSRSFGYVRSPYTFTHLGLAWAASGQPGLALAGIQRAAAVASTPEEKAQIHGVRASILMRQNDLEGSEKEFEEMLLQNPENADAMLGLARVEARRGSLSAARDWLEKARSSGVGDVMISFESASLDLAAGRAADARIKLTEVTDVFPNDKQAWAMLAVATLQMKDYDDVEKRILPKMLSISGTPDDYHSLIIKGQLLLDRDNNIAGARDAFVRASELQTGVTMLMELVLRLDFALADKISAEEHAHLLLRSNRNNSLANYIMGSISLGTGNIPRAEEYLRRSVNAKPTPEALNDLAELLRMSGDLDEAERRIREAISVAPDFYIVWDTLAGILLERGEIASAEEAYLKALELNNDADVRVKINYAKLLLRKGENLKARKLVMEANGKRSSLSEKEQAELAELVKRVTPGRK